MMGLYIRRYWIKTLADIYRCTKCSGVVADGNSYCRCCGHRFTVADVKEMRENIHTVFGALPWNTRDRYRCVHCLEFICISDDFCRGCGDEICGDEKQLMRANLKELAKNNVSSLIFCMGFVLFVIGSLMLVKA